MSDNLIKTLVDSGLSEKEAIIYTGLLELELASASEISKHSGLNRSSTYVVLEALKRKGLVGTSPDKKVKKYFASSPDILLFNVRSSASKHEKIKNSIESIIPELKAMHKDTKHRPKVRVYEGLNGLMNTFKDTLTIREKMFRVYSSHENLFRKMPNQFIKVLEDYVEMRKNKKIKMRSIHPDTTEAREIVTNVLPVFDEWVLIPRNKFEFFVDLAIYDNKIAYISDEKEGIGIIIESEGVAKVMKNIFDLAWDKANQIGTFKKDEKK